MSSLTRDLASRLVRLGYAITRSTEGLGLYRLDGVPLWRILCDETADEAKALQHFARSRQAGFLRVVVFGSPDIRVLVDHLDLAAVGERIRSKEVNAAVRAAVDRTLAQGEQASRMVPCGRARVKVCLLPLADWLDVLSCWRGVGSPQPLTWSPAPPVAARGVLRDYHAMRLSEFDERSRSVSGTGIDAGLVDMGGGAGGQSWETGHGARSGSSR